MKEPEWIDESVFFFLRSFFDEVAAARQLRAVRSCAVCPELHRWLNRAAQLLEVVPNGRRALLPAFLESAREAWEAHPEWACVTLRAREALWLEQLTAGPELEPSYAWRALCAAAESGRLAQRAQQEWLRHRQLEEPKARAAEPAAWADRHLRFAVGQRGAALQALAEGGDSVYWLEQLRLADDRLLRLQSLAA